MILTCIVILAIGCALIKAAGPLVIGERPLPAAATRFVALLVPALLAGLVVATAVGGRDGFVFDSRLPGIASAIVVARLRGPLVLALAVAAATTAAVEWLT